MPKHLHHQAQDECLVMRTRVKTTRLEISKRVRWLDEAGTSLLDLNGSGTDSLHLINISPDVKPVFFGLKLIDF